MGFNNGLERVRLENQWKKLRAQYRAAGMSEDAIQAMYEFDLRVVNSEQTYYRHTIDFSINNTEADGSQDTRCYEEAVLATDTYRETKSHFTWIGEIADERLLSALESLSDDDLQLITLYIYEAYDTVEISKAFGTTKQNISKKIRRIAKYIKNFQNEVV